MVTVYMHHCVITYYHMITSTDYGIIIRAKETQTTE